MPKQIINPAGLARPSGFSHAILAEGGRLLFLAGQDASDADGRIVGRGDLVAQFEQVLRNLGVVLAAAGGQMQAIVKLNIFVKDRDDYLAHRRELGELFGRAFGGYYPAIALFEVSGFFQAECLVECEGIAVL
ncbi:MAG: RidA family protein [Candidatus Promineifilaceae bacterium]